MFIRNQHIQMSSNFFKCANFSSDSDKTLILGPLALKFLF